MKRGVTVWWDSTAMRISDTLSDKIRAGLNGARCGVVIVSRGYLDSGWGQTELGAMFLKNFPIFPILHGVTAEEAQRSLPPLSGKLMRHWADSPEFNMDEIADAIKDSSGGQAGWIDSNTPAPRDPPPGRDAPVKAAASPAGKTHRRDMGAPGPPLPFGHLPPAQVASSSGGRARRVQSLLSKDESSTLEFKSWPASRPDRPRESSGMSEKIAKVLCSFANTDGGDLLIGVGDGGEVEGLAPGGRRLSRKERDDMLTWLTNVVADYLGANHDGRFDREIVEVGGLDVLHCRVVASKDGPVILKKRLEGNTTFS